MHDVPDHRDAELALRLYDLRRESELRKARAMLGDKADGASWETIQELRTYGTKHNAHFRQATSYWEMAASFVNRGIFHADVFLDTCGEALFSYAMLKPHVARLRETGSPRFFVQLEKVVTDHPACAERVAMIEKALAAWRKEPSAAPAPSGGAKRVKGAKARTSTSAKKVTRARLR